jgi:tRNA threonylcarbamoyladenosine biosynthesis protein TsaB
MMVLAIESATELAGVALADEAGVIATATVSRGRHHVESIAPAVRFVCRRAGVALASLDVLAVDVGPGLFTGLRVGVGTAQALAFGLGKPLVGIGSLEVLAHAVATSGAAPGTLVVPVVDAKRGEVFTARLRTALDAVAWEGDEVRRSPEALVAELSDLDEPFVLAGDGVRRYRSMFRFVPGAVMAKDPLDFPAPGVLATLALSKVARGEGDDPGHAATVLPRYLREAETRINWRTRRPRVDGER